MCHKCKVFLLLGLVDVSTAFSQVEVHLVAGEAALHLQQSRVFSLVSQAALVAGKDGLTPQSVTNTATVRRLPSPVQHDSFPSAR